MSHHYSSYVPVNLLLNAYSQKAHDQNVWLTIDGGGFNENQLGDQFERCLEKVLDCAMDSCINSTPKTKRYMKVRSIEKQNRIFIKIVSSYDKEVCCDEIKKLRKFFENKGVYFNYKIENNENLMMMAIPV